MSEVALDCSIEVAGLVGSRDWSTAADPSWNNIILRMCSFSQRVQRETAGRGVACLVSSRRRCSIWGKAGRVSEYMTMPWVPL